MWIPNVLTYIYTVYVAYTHKENIQKQLICFKQEQFKTRFKHQTEESTELHYNALYLAGKLRERKQPAFQR